MAIVCWWLTKNFGGRIDILLLVSDKYTNMQISHRLRKHYSYTKFFPFFFFVFVFFFFMPTELELSRKSLLILRKEFLLKTM